MTEAPDLDQDLELLTRIEALPVDDQWRVIGSLTDPQAREWRERCPIWAHEGQRSPGGEPHVWARHRRRRPIPICWRWPRRRAGASG